MGVRAALLVLLCDGKLPYHFWCRSEELCALFLCETNLLVDGPAPIVIRPNISPPFAQRLLLYALCMGGGGMAVSHCLPHAVDVNYCGPQSIFHLPVMFEPATITEPNRDQRSTAAAALIPYFICITRHADSRIMTYIPANITHSTASNNSRNGRSCDCSSLLILLLLLLLLHSL